MARPQKAIRWTLILAATEFGLDPMTLSKRLRAEGIEAEADGCFSTKQILVAVAGDLEREKTRNEAAAADLREMKRDEMQGNLIPKATVRAALEEVSASLRQVIDHSALSIKQKEAAYGNIRKLGELEYVERPEPNAEV